MSAAAEGANAGGFDASQSAAGGRNPWLIAVVVSIATFMEVLDTTIANVALRYISGTLAVSADEASWVVTSYLVANAIVLTASSFIAKRYGRKRFYLTCLGLFTASSIACGFAWNLESLLLFRVLQGFAGGGMVPISQSILADSFPPAKRGQAFAIFGIAVVVAPVVGPTLGGWLSDNLSWHWCFLINGPVGLFAFALVSFLVQEPKSAIEERQRMKRQGIRMDVIGFLLVATFLGSLEVILDRGQTDDWFASGFIIIFTVICVAAFCLMIPWDLTRLNPDSTFWFFAWSRIYIGIGLPLIFIPITTASYDGIPRDKTDQASALINVARNVGGSIGVSIAQNVLAMREQFHHSRLVETIVPSNPAYQHTLEQATTYFSTTGGQAGARERAIAYIGQQVQMQTAYWAYIDVFFTLMLISASAVPLALILRRVKH
ncbi:DHA2 family efflux MFS transporter permease subunit [Azospirillum sp. TSO5]|uniref:DHA2 family efflux MFS transporter permease subunit n=1 Tax=Azospirillum sp. TSO5 TaxID=716760 RepID=UPI000D60C00A|nr:DHA2 family efflux MFS transporter permease subunit [Azospirillum sp. TSO5]PWC86361.1 disulfide bond formation protein DsbA [Azospirillum sp. TSO5]